MRQHARLALSFLLAPPFGCGLPWWPFCLGFEQIWGNFDFQPHCPTHTGAEKRPCGVWCQSTVFPRRTGRLSILTAPSLQNLTWFAPGVLILTRLALGAPRWGPLWGRQGVGIDQDYGANAQQGAPTRAVRGRPGECPSWTGHRGPGLTPRPARPRTTRPCADAASKSNALQLGRAGVGTAHPGAHGSAFGCPRSLCHSGPPHAAHGHRIPPRHAVRTRP